MGPWRGDDPQKSVTNVTVATDAQTKVVVARRIKGPAPDGWVGGYAESPASLGDIKAGDFVSVELRPESTRPLAAKITRILIEP